MKLDLSNFQGVVAGLTVGGGTCDLPPRVEVPTRSEPELALLMQKVEAMSIAEIDRLMVQASRAERLFTIGKKAN